MAVYYYNHEAELYHSAMAAYDPEWYGEDPSELYHYGRKGMRRGMHLPDVLDPTRELIGKRVDASVALARRKAALAARGARSVYNRGIREVRGAVGSVRKNLANNVYAKRLAKYGTMAKKKVHELGNEVNVGYGKLREEYENAGKKYKNKKAKEQAEYEDFKKYKAEKAAKKKFDNLSPERVSKKKSEMAKAKINELEKKAASASTPEEARKYRDQAHELRKSESNRLDREKWDKINRERSRTAGEASMKEAAKANAHRAAKGGRKAREEKLNNDPEYARQYNQKQYTDSLAKAPSDYENHKAKNEYEQRVAEERARDARIREAEERRKKEEVAYKLAKKYGGKIRNHSSGSKPRYKR